MRRLLFVLALCVGVVGGALPALAAHESGSEGVATDACRELPEDRDTTDPEPWTHATGQACDTVRVTTWNLADGCWEVGAPATVCEPLYGQPVSDQQIDDFEGGWVELAHRDQHRWAQPLPMRDRSVVATHNSYNAMVYGPALARMDPNQTYGMRDQLRMGVRRLELDVHWFADTTTPDPSDRRPVLCHARGTVPGTVVTDHTGCTLEFSLAEGLTEIDGWLDQHRDTFVMLRLETHLEGVDGHDAAAADLRAVIGDHLYAPPADGACHGFDLDLTADDVLASGAHVLAISSCGPAGSSWRGLVWDDGAVRVETTYKATHREAFRAGRCPTPGDPAADLPGYPIDAWVRFYDDGTWLSATAARAEGKPVPVHAAPADAAAWMACGVNQPAFDFLTPTDGRMEAMVWSWASEENLETGRDRCAVLAEDGRFHSERCGAPPAPRPANDLARGGPFDDDGAPGVRPVSRPYLCATSTGFAVTSVSGPHAGGDEACAAEFGGAFTFPRTNPQALAADAARRAGGADEVWLSLTWDGTAWT